MANDHEPSMYQRMDKLEQQNQELLERVGKLELTMASLSEMAENIKKISQVVVAWDSLRGFDRTMKWIIIRVCALAGAITGIGTIIYAIRHGFMGK